MTDYKADSLDVLLAGKANNQPLVCAKCRVPVNTMKYSDGEISFVHGQSYRHHDHDPIPIVIPRGEKYASDCDFCSVRAQMYWVFCSGKMVIGKHNFGTKWNACLDCGPLVRKGDWDALEERVLRINARIRKLPRDERQEKLEFFRQLWSMLRLTLEEIMYVGPYTEPARLSARLLPKIQDGLLRFWGSEHWADALLNTPGRDDLFSIPGVHAGDEDQFHVIYSSGTPIPRNVWGNHTQHLRAGIGVSSLYWISTEFTHLANMAGQELEKMVVSREELPSPFGVMVFEEPIGVIKRGNEDVHIVAVSWSLVPRGVWINLYFQPEEGTEADFDVEMVRNRLGYLMCPNPGVGLKFDKEYDIPEEGGVSFALTVLATWFLINQPGVTELTSAPVDKKLVRSAARAGRKLPDVQIVDLRKRARRTTTAGGEAHVRGPLTVRVYRRGHWKRQAYGPERSLRKTIYVSPYIAGPEDAPLKERPTTVRVLR